MKDGWIFHSYVAVYQRVFEAWKSLGDTQYPMKYLKYLTWSHEKW